MELDGELICIACDNQAVVECGSCFNEVIYYCENCDSRYHSECYGTVDHKRKPMQPESGFIVGLPPPEITQTSGFAPSKTSIFPSSFGHGSPQTRDLPPDYGLPKKSGSPGTTRGPLETQGLSPGCSPLSVPPSGTRRPDSSGLLVGLPPPEISQTPGFPRSKTSMFPYSSVQGSPQTRKLPPEYGPKKSGSLATTRMGVTTTRRPETPREADSGTHMCPSFLAYRKVLQKPPNSGPSSTTHSSTSRRGSRSQTPSGEHKYSSPSGGNICPPPSAVERPKNNCAGCGCYPSVGCVTSRQEPILYYCETCFKNCLPGGFPGTTLYISKP